MNPPILHPERYSLPAEWYPQDGVLLTWPHRDTDWQEYLDEITATYLNITRAIADRERVVIASPEPKALSELLRRELTLTQLQHIHIYACESNDTWARDHGALTLTAEESDGEPPCLLLDFRFNGWGQKFAAEKDNTINRQLYAQDTFCVPMEDHDDFVLEGGSIESDGRGTLFTTGCCLLAPHRNQPLNRQEIEEQLKKRLHAKRVVWIEHGTLIGDDTDGHIDTLVRIAPNDTLVYCGPGNNDDDQDIGLKAMRQQLQTLRTTEDIPYRLIELPLPSPIYYDGERLPATYANFLIINGSVLVPTYSQPDNDARAIEQIKTAFPGYEIIGIDSTIIIRQHGSIHCLTMQFPIHTLHRPISQ